MSGSKVRAWMGAAAVLALLGAAVGVVYEKRWAAEAPPPAVAAVHRRPQLPHPRVLAAPPGVWRMPDVADADVAGLPPLVPVLSAFGSGAVAPKPVTTDELAAEYPAFHHRPFGMAGFVPLMLPFRYEDPSNVGDPSEANAFSFLLSDALDWAPGSYCKRHAYFVFKRSQAQMQPLSDGYDSRAIAQLEHDWTATHAIGGVLKRDAAGCTGTLEIYDPSGRVVFTKPYDAARSYFDLLGDMAVDAMNFFHEPASPVLAAYLHQPRCQHEESIIRLGLAAFAPERSEAEFNLYRQILQQDPDFAEVRYWWANQAQWADGGSQLDANLQFGLSLKSRLTLSALETFDPAQCANRALADEFPAWRNQASLMMGEDAPVVQEWRMQSLLSNRQTDPAAFDRALKVAQRFPNDRNLALDLVQCIEQGNAGATDLPLAASLAVSGLLDRYQNPRNDRHEPVEALGCALVLMGRSDEASGLLPKYNGRDSWELYQTTAALADVGQFAGAAAYYNAHARQMSGDEFGVTAAADTALAAVAVNDSATLEALRRRWKDDFEDAGITPLLDRLQDAAAGKPVNLDEPDTLCQERFSRLCYRERLLLAGQVDQMLHHRRLLKRVWGEACQRPRDRLLWVLLDGYQRQQPVEESPAFYRSLDWLFPDDAWVHQAAQDWRARVQATVHPGEVLMQPVALEDVRDPPQKVLTMLKDYAPDAAPPITRDAFQRMMALRGIMYTASPWEIVDAIHWLVVHHQADAAHDAALRFQHLAADTGVVELRGWATRLAQMTQTSATDSSGQVE